MPKKTKKEKIIAQQRRRNIPAFRTDDNQSILDRPNSSNSYSFTTNQLKKASELHNQNDTEVLAIKYDLLKTLIFAGIAISVEFILYFAIRK